MSMPTEDLTDHATRDTAPTRIRDRFRLPEADHHPSCCCPSCSLAKLVRPRYFSGQLLTDDTLRAEQDYQIAKDRLHNRYLHGVGVVCGLEVVCNDCDKESVTIRPGYALGPCGEDIIVPKDHDVNVIEAINRCLPSKREPCDPIKEPRSKQCDEGEQHWCITLEYHEVNATPQAVLSKRCHCNGGSGHRDQCEHTRVCEDYRVGVVERACTTCSDSSFQESEFAKALGELAVVVKYLAARAGGQILAVVASTAFGNPSGTSAETNAALIATRSALCELLDRNPLGVPCPDPAVLKQIKIPELTDGDDSQDHVTEAQRQAAWHLMAVLIDHLRDWFCHKLLPPCPPDPCDDRIVLGCVTVVDGAVVDVCNFECRTRAGSFPARTYWWSLSGLRPLFLMLLELLCCTDLIRVRSPIQDKLLQLVDTVDPDGSLLKSVSAGEFSIVRDIVADLTEARRDVTLAGARDAVKERLPADDAVDLSPDIGRNVGDVAAKLKALGVPFTVRESAVRPRFRSTRATVNPGDEVVVVKNPNTGRVIGFERVPASGADVSALQSELAELRAEVAELKKSAKQPAARSASKSSAATKRSSSRRKPKS